MPTLTVDGLTLTSERLSPETLAGHDVVVIATDHSTIDYQSLVDAARLVVDTRNATARVTRGRERIAKL